MKILITGANGFIGRHLVEHLLEVGHAVTAGVRTSGAAPAGTREVIIGDIGPDTNWVGILGGHDAVVHLAARVHVMRDHSGDPLEEFRRVNTAGTARLARAAAEQGVPRFVFLSSIKVNGERTNGVPLTAQDTPQPQDPYGVSKYEAELALRQLERESGFELVIVRTPLVYGPHVHGNFEKLLGLASRGVPLPLASVENRRTMTSIWNLVDLLEKSASDTEAAGALVLAGDACSPSTAQLLRELSAAMGKRSRLFRFPVALLRLAGRISGGSAMVERLTGSLEIVPGASTTRLTWFPPFTFKDSIQRTVDSYTDYHNREGANGAE